MQSVKRNLLYKSAILGLMLLGSYSQRLNVFAKQINKNMQESLQILFQQETNANQQQYLDSCMYNFQVEIETTTENAWILTNSSNGELVLSSADEFRYLNQGSYVFTIQGVFTTYQLFVNSSLIYESTADQQTIVYITIATNSEIQAFNGLDTQNGGANHKNTMIHDMLTYVFGSLLVVCFLFLFSAPFVLDPLSRVSIRRGQGFEEESEFSTKTEISDSEYEEEYLELGLTMQMFEHKLQEDEIIVIYEDQDDDQIDLVQGQAVYKKRQGNFIIVKYLQVLSKSWNSKGSCSI